jgi:diguanylate cyclase
MAQNVTAGAVEVDKIVPRFTDVVAVLDRQLDEERKVRVGLQRLLALLCSNIKDLTPDEAWLAGQLEPLRALLAGPIKSSALEQAETRLAQLIAQQAGARRSLLEAKIALKEMLATLIARVGSMGASTGKYYEQVGAYQRELEQANDFATLSRVIQGLLADTALMRTDIQASQAELEGARRKVEAYEQRVRDLERELTQVSTLVQKDPLTTALNRRGLEEAFRLESARATRFRSALSLMMIDLDDFKRLNDSMGHVAGDRALVYFANLIQATLRPTDQIARLGGEEFALLLPATEVAEAVAAGQRLQRELAKQAFDYEGQSRAISFSGGAAQWTAQEQLEDLIRRADRALYEAKRLGKNRVVKAE